MVSKNMTFAETEEVEAQLDALYAVVSNDRLLYHGNSVAKFFLYTARVKFTSKRYGVFYQ
jgi:hypothetical protein